MNQERLMKVLVGPIVSEKSTMIGEKHNLNLKGKQKRFGRFMGKRNDVRKAYVSLAKDQEIKFEQEVM